MTTFPWASGIAAATLALGLITSAYAQQPSTSPAAKPAPAVPSAAAKAPAPAADTKKAAKPASPCQDLDQKACSGKADCSWIAATKRKDGKEVKAYCRLKPKTVAKAAAKPAPAPAATAKAAPAMPAAPGTPQKK